MRWWRLHITLRPKVTGCATTVQSAVQLRWLADPQRLHHSRVAHLVKCFGSYLLANHRKFLGLNVKEMSSR